MAVPRAGVFLIGFFGIPEPSHMRALARLRARLDFSPTLERGTDKTDKTPSGGAQPGSQPLDPRAQIPDLATALLGKCRSCRFTAPLNASKLCGKCACGFGASSPSSADAGTVGTPTDWTDDRAWIAEIVRHKDPYCDAVLALLFAWVLAAGGWIDGMTADLPDLPHRLAALELRRMLRRSGIGIGPLP